MMPEKYHPHMEAVIEGLLGGLSPLTPPIKSIYLFGLITTERFDWQHDEINVLIVVDSEKNSAAVRARYEAVLEKLENDYGMMGATASHSSTRHLVIGVELLSAPSEWPHHAVRPEWMEIIRQSGSLIAGEEVRDQIPVLGDELIEQSMKVLELPFTLEQAAEVRLRNPVLDRFLRPLGYKSLERSSDRFELTEVDDEADYIRRPSLEDILRMEIDKYLKKSAISHIFFKGSERFEGKTSLLKFTMIRCRERGLPVRAWCDKNWLAMNKSEKLECITAQIAALKSRRWAIFLIDNAECFENLDEVYTQIETAGFITVAAGVTGGTLIKKRENLRVIKLVKYPFPRPALINHLRLRFEHAGLLHPKSPILASIVRVTDNPFKAGAMAAGILIEAALAAGDVVDPHAMGPLLPRWEERAASREFYSWCLFLSDPTSMLPKEK